MDKKQKEVIVYSTQIMNFLEELVGGANHEINNLLFVIGMSSELLESPSSLKERQNAIKNIETQAKRIGEVLKDLRSVVKDCSSEAVKQTQLSEVSDHVIELCKTRFNNHKIIFKNNVPDNLFIDARETQLTQAFLAILNSAHDAVVEKKSMTRWINFDVQQTKGDLQILISDSGAKISEADSSNIFTPSFDSNGRKGLPLILAKNIIESHGGDISYSQDADVNTFVVKFSSYKKSTGAELGVTTAHYIDELEEKQVVPYLKVV